MSADTEEVTPPPDVTLGEQPQSKVQSSAQCVNTSYDVESPESQGASWISSSSMKPRIFSRSHFNSASMFSSPSFKAEPIPESHFNSASMFSSPSFKAEPIPECQTVHGNGRGLSTQTYGGGYGASMRNNRPMEPRNSSSSPGGMEKQLLRFKPQQIPPFAYRRSNESLDPLLSFSGQQNPEFPQTFHGYGRVDSTESYGLSMMRNNNRSMEPTFFFRSAGNMRFSSMISPTSFKPQPIPRTFLSLCIFWDVESPESYGAPMKRNYNYMEERISSCSARRKRKMPMDPTASFKQQNPERSYRSAPGCYMEPWMSPCNRTMGILVN